MTEKIIDAEFEEVSPPTQAVSRLDPEVEIERLKTQRSVAMTARSAYRWLCISVTIVVSSTVVSCARMCEAIVG